MSEKYSKEEIESYKKKINKYYKGINNENYAKPIEMIYINENGKKIKEGINGKFSALNFVYKLIEKVPRPMYNIIFNKEQATTFVRVIQQYILKTRRPNIQINDKSFPKQLKYSSDEFNNLIKPRLVTKIPSIIKTFNITERDLNEDDPFYVKSNTQKLDPLLLPEDAPYAPESPNYFKIVPGERRGNESPPFIPTSSSMNPLQHIPIGSIKEMEQTLHEELNEDLSLLKSKLESIDLQDKKQVNKELLDEHKYFFFKKKFDLLSKEEIDKLIQDNIYLYTEQYNYQIKQMSNYEIFREQMFQYMNQLIIQFRYSILNVRNKYYKLKEEMTDELLLYKKILDVQTLQNRRKIQSLVRTNKLQISNIIKYSDDPLSIVPFINSYQVTSVSAPKPKIKQRTAKQEIPVIVEEPVLPKPKSVVKPKPKQRTAKQVVEKQVIVEEPVLPKPKSGVKPKPKQRTMNAKVNSLNMRKNVGTKNNGTKKKTLKPKPSYRTRTIVP
jgi:hypothetical protein